MTLDETHDPDLVCRVPVEADSDFPMQNLPLGVFSTASDPTPRVGVAIGAAILDLGLLADAGHLPGTSQDYRISVARAAHPDRRPELRHLLSRLLREPGPDLALVDQATATMHLPYRIRDYVDFYSSRHHAEHVGRLYRPDEASLPEAWEHLPIGYHGRSGTIVVSETPIRRPAGQKLVGGQPVFGPTERLDFELEVGFFVGARSEHGNPVPIDRAESHLSGFVLVNDWSARDLQAWEYRPLGPFLGKSFATSISPWLVTPEALAPYRVEGPGDLAPLGYLQTEGATHLDLALEVRLNGHVVTRANARTLSWSFGQQIAHLTSNGASLRIGDLQATGTVSGPGPGEFGCLLEATENGTAPITVGGSSRTWLEDGDVVEIRGWCGGASRPRIGLGVCRGRVSPAQAA